MSKTRQHYAVLNSLSPEQVYAMRLHDLAVRAHGNFVKTLVCRDRHASVRLRSKRHVQLEGAFFKAILKIKAEGRE